jgi:hypothetical protein
MMNARIVCHQGHVLDALAIYDAVAESVRPIRSGRAQAIGIRNQMSRRGADTDLNLSWRLCDSAARRCLRQANNPITPSPVA